MGIVADQASCEMAWCARVTKWVLAHPERRKLLILAHYAGRNRAPESPYRCSIGTKARFCSPT
jgi:hypothetical protein